MSFTAFITHRARLPFIHKAGVILPYSNPRESAELHSSQSGSIRKISHFNEWPQPLQVPDVRVIKYPSDDWAIESLLVLPPDYEPGRKYPALIYWHGGPLGRAGLIAVHGLYRGIQIENQLRWQAGSNDLLIQHPQFVNQRGTETTKPDQFLVQQAVMRAASAQKMT